MKSILLMAATDLPCLQQACDNLSERRVKDAAVLTNGGDARVGRVVIRKYGCNACHEISGVPGARGLDWTSAHEHRGSATTSQAS